ncbi:MAG: DinB family protein [Phycisphaerales bacterium]
MDRVELVSWWDEAWKTGLWAAAWGKAVAGLTPKQAAWSPGPGRKSIWQQVNHVVFWRTMALRRLRGGQGPSDLEMKRGNWAGPTKVTPAAWRATVKRFADSQKKVRAAMANTKSPLDRLRYLLPHDNYDVGQIMLLRALQGLEPLE